MCDGRRACDCIRLADWGHVTRAATELRRCMCRAGCASARGSRCADKCVGGGAHVCAAPSCRLPLWPRIGHMRRAFLRVACFWWDVPRGIAFTNILGFCWTARGQWQHMAMTAGCAERRCCCCTTWHCRMDGGQRPARQVYGGACVCHGHRRSFRVWSSARNPCRARQCRYTIAAVCMRTHVLCVKSRVRLADPNQVCTGINGWEVGRWEVARL